MNVLPMALAIVYFMCLTPSMGTADGSDGRIRNSSSR